MRKLLTVLFILVTSAVYSQSKALVHINAEFNKSNDWYGLEAVDNVKLFGGYVSLRASRLQTNDWHELPTGFDLKALQTESSLPSTRRLSTAKGGSALC